MTPVCAPDVAQGIAVRLSQYVGCEARALGENGFQALAGGPIGSGVLSGLVTIFIALIGYRFILGRTPNMRDGIGWAARLGLVLALVTSWPAFQTLIFRVATDGPSEVSNVILPVAGLGTADLETRVQEAYDTMRLGTFDTAPMATTAAAASAGTALGAQPFKFETPLPNTASLLVISTLGVLASLQIAIGFLLAIAPLPLMSLLFDATSGLFSGWLRALAGAAMMTIAATLVTSVDMVMIESELGHLETYRTSMTAQMIDPQALTTIVALFAFVMLITLLLSSRVASVVKVPERLFYLAAAEDASATAAAGAAWRAPSANFESLATTTNVHEQTRVRSVSQAVVKAADREQILAAARETPSGFSRHGRVAEAADRMRPNVAPPQVLTAGRRRPARRTHSAIRRDKRA